MSSIHKAIGAVFLDANFPDGEATPRTLAFSAMKYTHGRITRTTQHYLRHMGRSPSNWQEALDNEGALCQGIVWAMQAILVAFGIRSREVGVFFDEDRTHVVLEVEWDDKPHVFDPTYGAWFQREDDILSFEEIDEEKDPQSLMLYDALSVVDAYKPFDYIEKPGRELVYHDWM